MSAPDGRAGRLGFVGVGSIGRPIAERLLAVGRELAICERDDSAACGFTGRAERFATPLDLAQACGIVFTCLPSAEACRAVVAGEHGLSRSVGGGLCIHLGTNGRPLIEELAGELASAGWSLLDAPVSGGVAGARAGTLVSMVSGTDAAFEIARPLIEAYSARIVRLGQEPGLAQTMKLVNNMLSATNLAAAAHVMVVGVHAGLDARVMLDVLNAGTGQNSATLTKLPDNILTGGFDCGSALTNAQKDLGAYLDEAREAGLSTRMAESVLQAFADAVALRGETADISTVIIPFERSAGVSVRAKAFEG